MEENRPVEEQPLEEQTARTGGKRLIEGGSAERHTEQKGSLLHRGKRLLKKAQESCADLSDRVLDWRDEMTDHFDDIAEDPDNDSIAARLLRESDQIVEGIEEQQRETEEEEEKEERRRESKNHPKRVVETGSVDLTSRFVFYDMDSAPTQDREGQPLDLDRIPRSKDAPMETETVKVVAADEDGGDEPGADGSVRLISTGKIPVDRVLAGEKSAAWSERKSPYEDVEGIPTYREPEEEQPEPVSLPEAASTEGEPEEVSTHPEPEIIPVSTEQPEKTEKPVEPRTARPDASDARKAKRKSASRKESKARNRTSERPRRKAKPRAERETEATVRDERPQRKQTPVRPTQRLTGEQRRAAAQSARRVQSGLVWTVLGLFALLGILGFLRPGNSGLVDRELTDRPPVNLVELWNGNWFAKLDQWYSDTFPGRDALEGGYRKLNGLGFGPVRQQEPAAEPAALPEGETPETATPETETPAAETSAEETQTAPAQA